jgi:hypothetical protein
MALVKLWQTFSFKYEGEAVRVRLRRFTNKAMFAFMTDFDPKSSKEDYPDLIGSILKDHVEVISGLEIEDRAGVIRKANASDIANEACFDDLCASILEKISDISNLPKADKKKSNRQSNLEKLENQA